MPTKNAEADTRTEISDRAAPVETREVAIGIIVTGDNHRLPKREKEQIADLAASMAANGQLQAIAVMAGDEDTCELIYGKRRLLAAQELGWDTIKAEIWPRMPASEVARRRAVENLHRQDLAPTEEAIAVVQLIDTIAKDHPGLTAGELHERAGEALGRSARWVRDRAYLTNLSAKCRDWTTAGVLSLAKAREIAKLDDKGVQDDLGRYARTNDEGLGGWSLEVTKRAVAGHLQSLTRCRWDLDVAFAGKPACDTCPSNSANDANLFEEGDAPKDPVCTNERCYKAKGKAIETSIEKGAQKIVKAAQKAANGDGSVTISADLVRKHKPKGVKASSLKRAAQKAIGQEDAAAPGAKKTANASRPSFDPKHPNNIARAEWGKLEIDFNSKVNESMEAIYSQGGRHALAMMIVESLAYALSLDVLYGSLSGKQERRNARLHSGVRALVVQILEITDPGIEAFAETATELLKERAKGQHSMFEDCEASEIARTLEVLGIEEIKAPPAQQEYIKRRVAELEAKSKKTTAKKTTRKAPAKKRATKKTAKKRAVTS